MFVTAVVSQFAMIRWRLYIFRLQIVCLQSVSKPRSRFVKLKSYESREEIQQIMVSIDQKGMVANE